MNQQSQQPKASRETSANATQKEKRFYIRSVISLLVSMTLFLSPLGHYGHRFAIMGKSMPASYHFLVVFLIAIGIGCGISGVRRGRLYSQSIALIGLLLTVIFGLFYACFMFNWVLRYFMD